MLASTVLAVCVASAYGTPAIVGPETAAGAIKNMFAARKKYFGNIADSGTLGNAKTKEILSTQFNALTAENR
jgi:hypothetical protein